MAAFKPVSSLLGILPQLLGIIAFILCAQLISNKWVPFLVGVLIGCLPIFFLFRPHHAPDLFIAITIGHLSSLIVFILAFSFLPRGKHPFKIGVLFGLAILLFNYASLIHPSMWKKRSFDWQW